MQRVAELGKEHALRANSEAIAFVIMALRASGVSSTRNAQPWLKPALGAWVAFSSARSMMAGSTGRSA